jgi:DNA-binding response OmpR family regulator
MKILIAEDDNVSRLVLLTKLGKMGHEVVATEDGEAAWSSFLAERPQLIITDWMMPKVDGLDLCRMIRSHVQEKYAYVIFLTALTGKKYYYEGMEAGADDFLNKPVDMDELTARLRVAERILSLHTEVAQLEGLLPICSYCKKIRDEKDTWQPIEGYISTRTEATFSHGVCPSCIEKYMKPEMEAYRIKKLSKT